MADVIGIEIEAVNLAKEYKERVFADFLREIRPAANPDVLCNAEIKFARSSIMRWRWGAEMIATGHYARTRVTDSGVELRGVDPTKDQSYFLHRLTQEQVSKVIFPGGTSQNGECAASRKNGLPNEEEGLDRDLLHRRTAFPRIPEPLPPHRLGPHEDPGRRVVRSLRLGSLHVGPARRASARRHEGVDGRTEFSRRSDLATNTLWICQGTTIRASSHGSVGRALLGGGAAPEPGDDLTVKTRYRQPDGPAVWRTCRRKSFTLEFDEPQWAATLVRARCSTAGTCVWGGFIHETKH